MVDFSTTLVYDIDKIASFVFGNPNDRSSEVEIVESYEYDKDEKKMIPSTRQVKEVKANDYTGQNSLRYDIIKGMMEKLDTVEDFDSMTLGESIALNTMEHNGFIINDNDNEQ